MNLIDFKKDLSNLNKDLKKKEVESRNSHRTTPNSSYRE